MCFCSKAGRERMYIFGMYKSSMDLISTGRVPRVGHGPQVCEARSLPLCRVLSFKTVVLHRSKHCGPLKFPLLG